MPRPIQIKQESTSNYAETLISKASLKFYDCLVGGKKLKLTVDQQSSINVMSLTLFNKLQRENFNFFTTDMVSYKFKEFTFVGHHISKVELNNQSEFINFSVREGTEDYVMISIKLAHKLGLF